MIQYQVKQYLVLFVIYIVIDIDIYWYIILIYNIDVYIVVIYHKVSF